MFLWMAKETTNSKRTCLFHSGRRLRATRCASPEVSHNPQTLLSFRSQQNKATDGTCATLPPKPARLTFTGDTFLKQINCYVPSDVSTSVNLIDALIYTWISYDGARDGKDRGHSSVPPTNTDELYIKAST